MRAPICGYRRAVRKLRIVLVSDWFSEPMGYIENRLPPAFARFGHEVHVVTSNAQTYFTAPDYHEIYEPFLGPALVPCGTAMTEGYVLHRLPVMRIRGRIGIRGLMPELARLRADIVQVLDPISLTTYVAAVGRVRLGYRLFIANHVHTSVFPAARRGYRRSLMSRLKDDFTVWLPGRLVSSVTEKCYATSADTAEIAERFFGFERRKIVLSPLGVDTDRFHPPTEADLDGRARLRRSLDIADDRIVCVYSGRFSAQKDPLCLARAIGELASQGAPYAGLFVGDGPQRHQILRQAGCRVVPFVPFTELGAYYRAADIGVWPRQESTSMLDASATGLPIVISDRVQAPERIEGTGLTYREDDIGDLARALSRLADPDLRRSLGRTGAERIARDHSWDSIARRRLLDYQASLSR